MTSQAQKKQWLLFIILSSLFLISSSVSVPITVDIHMIFPDDEIIFCTDDVEEQVLGVLSECMNENYPRVNPDAANENIEFFIAGFDDSLSVDNVGVRRELLTSTGVGSSVSTGSSGSSVLSGSASSPVSSGSSGTSGTSGTSGASASSGSVPVVGGFDCGIRSSYNPCTRGATRCATACGYGLDSSRRRLNETGEVEVVQLLNSNIDKIYSIRLDTWTDLQTYTTICLREYIERNDIDCFGYRDKVMTYLDVYFA